MAPGAEYESRRGYQWLSMWMGVAHSSRVWRPLVALGSSSGQLVMGTGKWGTTTSIITMAMGTVDSPHTSEASHIRWLMQWGMAMPPSRGTWICTYHDQQNTLWTQRQTCLPPFIAAGGGFLCRVPLCWASRVLKTKFPDTPIPRCLHSTNKVPSPSTDPEPVPALPSPGTGWER